MSFMTKIAIVLLCFSLCGAGTFIASSARKENEPRKTNVIPVKNREAIRHGWIVAALL
jgi:hypothetical protein